MWGIYLFLVVFVTIRGFQKGQKLKQEFLRHHAPPSEEEIKEWKKAKFFSTLVPGGHCSSRNTG